MLYLIFLVLGPALIFLGKRSRNFYELPSNMHIMAALWLTVQVAGVFYESLKVKYDVSPGLTPFDLFDHTTWNGSQWFIVIGLVSYFVILFIWSILRKWPAYMLMLIGIALLEYDLLAFIVGVIMTSDFFLFRLLSVGLKLVLDIWAGVVAYLMIFGYFLPIGGRSSGSVSTGSAPSASGDGEDGETDFGSMPSSIHSMGGTTYYLRTNLGYGAEYVSSTDPDDTITITSVYSRTGSEMSTDAGHFRY